MDVKELLSGIALGAFKAITSGLKDLHDIKQGQKEKRRPRPRKRRK